MLAEQRKVLPASARRFVDHMVARNLLVNYAEPQCIVRVFDGVSRRLTRSNPLADAGQLLSDQQLMSVLRTSFKELMAHLTQFSKNYRPRAVERVASSV